MPPPHNSPNWVICEGISTLHLISQCYSHIMMDKLKGGNHRRQEEGWGDGLSGQLRKLNICWSRLVDQFSVSDVRNIELNGGFVHQVYFFSINGQQKALRVRVLNVILLEYKAGINAATSWRWKANTTHTSLLFPLMKWFLKTTNVWHTRSHFH